jgi:nucleotide-binding universal stress UspA family protein
MRRRPGAGAENRYCPGRAGASDEFGRRPAGTIDAIKASTAIRLSLFRHSREVPVRSSILCPIDFSDASRGALRYAGLIAPHLNADLVALTVEDPLVAEAESLGRGISWCPDAAERELAEFVGQSMEGLTAPPSPVECVVAVGKPAPEILRLARERACGLIVISARGLTGMRKLFFGSTTERVLRETTVPVLVTPAADAGPTTLEDVARTAHRILVPLDLSSDPKPLVDAAAAIARTLRVPALLVHVVEPVRTPFSARLRATRVDAERRARAEDELERLAGAGSAPRTEALVTYGDPAEELAKVAHDRLAGLIVIGLHGSPVSGPRMGSVTYRILCLTQALVVALPIQSVERPLQAQPELASEDC